MKNEDTFLGNINWQVFKPSREDDDASSISDGTSKGDLENWTPNPTSESRFNERVYVSSTTSTTTPIKISPPPSSPHSSDELSAANLVSSRANPTKIQKLRTAPWIDG